MARDWKRVESSQGQKHTEFCRINIACSVEVKTLKFAGRPRSIEKSRSKRSPGDGNVEIHISV